MCFWPERIAQTARRFLDGFPGKVLYAVKCNPHGIVLDAMYGAGIRNFDTASLNEIALVDERLRMLTAISIIRSKAARP